VQVEQRVRDRDVVRRERERTCDRIRRLAVAREDVRELLACFADVLARTYGKRARDLASRSDGRLADCANAVEATEASMSTEARDSGRTFIVVFS